MTENEPAAAEPTPDLRRIDRRALWAITLLGAALRVAYQLDRPWWGDEIGTLRFIEEPFGYILTHADGWLTMHYFIALEKVVATLFGTGWPALTAVPLVASVATIPITAHLARRFVDPRAALTAAFLVAVNPYLLEHSTMIRAYSLLACLSCLGLLLYLRQLEAPGAKRSAALAIGLVALCLAHPTGSYTAALIALVEGLRLAFRWRRGETTRSDRGAPVAMAVSGAIAAAAYAPFLGPLLELGASWHDTPPTGISYLPMVFTTYFAPGFWAWPTLALLAVAVYHSCRLGGRALALIAFPIAGVAIPSIQGIVHFPWGFARILIFVLPVLLVLCAMGVWRLTDRLPPGRRLLGGVAASVLLATTWLPNTLDVYQRATEYPWRDVALEIAEEVPEGTVVLGLSTAEAFHLRPYLEERAGAPMPRRLSAYLAKVRPRAKVSSVALVTSGEPIRTESPSGTWGLVQMVHYRADDLEGVLREMRVDLVATGEGRVAAELAPVYEAILGIDDVLGEDAEREAYVALWRDSRDLTEREVHMPLAVKTRRRYRLPADESFADAME